MSTSDHHFRVHPAIGFARVGNSDQYVLAPETGAGLPIEGEKYTGGIPLSPDTGEPIKSSEIRDSHGGLVRQGARFKIYAYDSAQADKYPNGGGEEVTLGSKIGGKTVKDIFWTVHLANKKANAYVLENPELGDRDLLIHGYENGNLPPLRNPGIGSGIANDTTRLKQLVIDPGPRTIQGTTSSQELVAFDKKDPASYFDDNKGEVVTIPNYPKTFPDDAFPGRMYNPWGKIDTLGELRSDQEGRLIVTGGYGRASSMLTEMRLHDTGGIIETPKGVEPPLMPYPLEEPVDNDGWFDDTGDGPVSAVILFDDDSRAEVHGGWVNVTDPDYAPQTQNVVSLWDDIYDTWIRKLDLTPEIWRDGAYCDGYQPSFPDQIQPFFIAASLQRWNTNLPKFAIAAHDAVGAIKATDCPSETIMAGLAFVRNPNVPKQSYQGAPFMPLSLGDNGKSFLSPSLSQYFFLSQWDANKFCQEPMRMGAGERLDRDVLINCLGGRFSPGIDMTFIVRQPDLYIDDWKTRGCGPFRIRPEKLDYSKARKDTPFLTEGYVPLHNNQNGLQPGDASKFMSAPWHTDYNSCGTHNTAPNPPEVSQPARTTLYWSWPAQRPVAVYTARDARYGELTEQKYSVRGPGTGSPDAANQGRFQNYIDFVLNWPRVGTIIQSTQIDTIPDGKFKDDWYLEVESLLTNENAAVEAWPINSSSASEN